MQKSKEEKIYRIEGIAVTVQYRRVRGTKGIRMKISSGDVVRITGNTRARLGDLESFFFLHQSWALEKLRHFQKFPNPTIKLSESAYRQKKEKARKVVGEKLALWNQYYGFSWKRVTIRNQSTRWGSCSSAGTLSFHAALIDLPEDLQDYLIVHELCHLRAMNHSSQFWKLVEKALPNAQARDLRLKKYTQGSIL